LGYCGVPLVKTFQGSANQGETLDRLQNKFKIVVGVFTMTRSGVNSEGRNFINMHGSPWPTEYHYFVRVPGANGAPPN
jgi:hypothetical protein